ncbi:diguanylate cyclase [Desulfonema magnum]|uniref:diguanylate cyclase n=1 Tax=Desulfonema magnum TaxID=45655 RepID=A0A975BPJ0_9BACT|nr:diguanylate cyclase [Desulfonema magnum]QTA89332.1 Two component system response regulator, GGDEF domain-containing [Desulfonema magnum]
MMKNKPKILVVDDSKNICNVLRRILSKEEYAVTMAEDGEAAIQKVFEWLPDLILLDLMMPKMDGLEVCRRLKSNYKYNFIYVIMLTAKNSAEDEVAGLDIGADDYVAKPFNPTILLARVRRGVRLMKEKLDATFDSLTRLYNRRVFDAFLQQEKAKFRRYNHSFSLILIDLDHFKKVNDTFGHKAGDMVLQEVARFLREDTRDADLPARWGGEEMAILLPETDMKGANILAESLRQRIERHHFPQVGHITASFGVASMRDDESDLVETADRALYRGKQMGRNKVVVAT